MLNVRPADFPQLFLVPNKTPKQINYSLLCKYSPQIWRHFDLLNAVKFNCLEAFSSLSHQIVLFGYDATTAACEVVLNVSGLETFKMSNINFTFYLDVLFFILFGYIIMNDFGCFLFASANICQCICHTFFATSNYTKLSK